MASTFGQMHFLKLDHGSGQVWDMYRYMTQSSDGNPKGSYKYYVIRDGVGGGKGKDNSL